MLLFRVYFWHFGTAPVERSGTLVFPAPARKAPT